MPFSMVVQHFALTTCLSAMPFYAKTFVAEMCAYCVSIKTRYRLQNARTLWIIVNRNWVHSASIRVCPGRALPLQSAPMKRPASGCGDQPNLFLEFAELILPWLPPPDLASVSSTCRTLRRMTQAITERRCPDASRGLEKYPVPFFNPVDDEPYAYFLYTSHAVLGNRSSSIFSQSWGGNYSCPSKFGPAHELSSLDVDVSEGCCCRECSVGHDGRGGCPCLGFNELLSGVELSVGSRMECGNSCSCSIDCPNRPTQRGIAVKLRIVKHLKKGWGLHAAEFVPRGEFLCEYVGKICINAIIFFWTSISLVL